ncbi:MAG: ROK family transcriptional regulator [Spirochaetales bacterium]|nr:ROK family transcriptional regulator [Spirochaetales bacterium]
MRNLLQSLTLKVRSHRIVLNTIRYKKEVSGAELSRITSYKPPTLVYILRTLEAKGLIEVSRIGESSSGSGGKPPTLWKLVPDTGYIIGIEVIPGKFRTSVIDFSCKVIHEEEKYFDDNIQAEMGITQLVDLIKSTITRLKLPKDKIIGISIASPGLINMQEGIIYYSKALKVKNFPFQEELEKKLGYPVLITNDANAGAMGVKWHRPDSDTLPPNIVFLSINADYCGMGAGFILNDELYEGASGSAGEIFSALPEIKPLIKKAKKTYPDTDLGFNPDKLRNSEVLIKIAERARENCPLCLSVLKSMGKPVIEELTDIIELFNPNLIIIGGDFTCAGFFIDDYISSRVKKKCLDIFPLGITIPDIKCSMLGVHSVSIGATALFMKEIFLMNSNGSVTP